MDINSYMIFGPIFFASIGLKTSFDHLNGEFVLFSLIGFQSLLQFACELEDHRLWSLALAQTVLNILFEMGTIEGYRKTGETLFMSCHGYMII